MWYEKATGQPEGELGPKARLMERVVNKRRRIVMLGTYVTAILG